MVELPRANARTILQEHTLGRLGCFSPGKSEVYVVPISYELRGDTAYFGCLPGQKLDYLRAHPEGVCLEVDEVRDERDWVSVVATGRFEELSEFEQAEELPAAIVRAAHGPIRLAFLHDPDSIGQRLVLCGLRIERISGRCDGSFITAHIKPALAGTRVL